MAVEIEGVGLSNGLMVLEPFSSTGSPVSIAVQDGATLLAGGSIALEPTGTLTLGNDLTLGAQDLQIATTNLNIGTAGSLASAGSALQAGWNLTPDELAGLIAGNSGPGVPTLQTLTVTASDSVNFFGTVDLSTIDPATGKSNLSLVLYTPAIYGSGSASDVATITTGTFIWGGLTQSIADPNGGYGATYQVSATAPSPMMGGAGTGSGTLNIVADDILFGYGPNTMPQDQIALNRTLAGFSTVNMTASQQITANNQESLSVYQSGTTGGTLNLNTPLLTGAAGSVMSYTAGNAINVAPPSGAIATSTSGVTALGAEIDLNAQAVALNTSIALPTGKLSVNASNGDITVGASATLDLSGRATPMFDLTEYSWGGTLTLASATGNITQASGSVIDVSAVDNAAGTVAATAASGQVALDGTLNGVTTLTSGFSMPSGDDWRGGSISVEAQTLGGNRLTADFATLNDALNSGGFFQSRVFDLKSGDLTIASDVKAKTVSVSVDNGSLIVNGLVDASGPAPGSITLAASNGLDLTGTANLDAQGTVLQADSYGNPIAAENQATVTLTASGGTLALDNGATINVRVTDPSNLNAGATQKVNYGDVELNAPRVGGSGTSATTGASVTDDTYSGLVAGSNAPANAQGDAIAVTAGNTLTIAGAGTIALNGFATYKNAPYSPSDPTTQIVDQSYMDLIDQDSTAFIDFTLGNATFMNGIAALTKYSTFHLRPGVEIDSATPTGNIVVSGDINFAGYRYGPNADTNSADAAYGAGEPGVFTLRAGGNLTVKGSMSDGFGQGADFPGAPASYSGVITDISTDNSFQYYPSNNSLLGDGIASYYDGSNDTYYFTEDWVVPSDQFYNDLGGIPTSSGSYGPGSTIPAGSSFAASNVAFEAGASLPILATTYTPASSDFAIPPTSVLAPMLKAGSLSWSITLASGADIGAAANSMLLSTSVLNNSGNLTLSNYHMDSLNSSSEMPSVIRTGTGALTLLAGGNFAEDSLYGVYTAGTQSSDVTSAYQTALAGQTDGTLFGSLYGTYNQIAAGTTGASYDTYWYPTNGGDLTLTAQGNITGDYVATVSYSNPTTVSDTTSNWLRLQGGAGIGQQSAWAINFGSYVIPRDQYGEISEPNGSVPSPVIEAFEGIGTLGGGNLTVTAGGSAGVLTSASISAANGQGVTTSTALTLAVGSTGRVSADGSIEETGGGALTLKVGGALNPYTLVSSARSYNLADWGTITDLRGNGLIEAGSVGFVQTGYNVANSDSPLSADPFLPMTAAAEGGPALGVGDSTISIDTRGDLALGTVFDPGRQTGEPASSGSYQGASEDVVSWFTLWTNASGVALNAAGGNVAPGTGNVGDTFLDTNATYDTYSTGDYFYPPNFSTIAESGNIYGNAVQVSPLSQDGQALYYTNNISTSGLTQIELAPSPSGQLALLAGESIYDNSASQQNGGTIWSMSGASLANLATPANPGWMLLKQGGGDSYGNFDTNVYLATNDFNGIGSGSPYGALFAYGFDTVTGDLHAGDTVPQYFYAVDGSLYDLHVGDMKYTTVQTYTYNQARGRYQYNDTYQWLYHQAKPVEVRAGQDIVNFGLPYTVVSQAPANPSSAQSPNFEGQNNNFQSLQGVISNLFLNNSAGDVSSVQAGGGIYYANAIVAGPGTLEVIAGGDIYQGARGLIETIGPLYDINPYDPNTGASVIVMPGVGVQGPDWTDFAERYFNPADQGDPEQNAGDVAQTYLDPLYQWLQARFGYSGSEAYALGYFLSLPVQQQSIFDLQAYFDELNASGLEFNNASSVRYKSYIRGKEAIATLFPTTDANGQPLTYGGSLTMESQVKSATLTVDSGIQTQFGGSIFVVAPGGGVTLGANALTPGSGTGLMTEGSGDINVYALDSIELGLSRVFTTFGGNIVMWSAEGDINAGKGAKGTTVFAPARRVYDNYGDVALSPTVPTTGAGIATLQPIEGIPAGNVNLVAPQGIVDAGEAGIRVSGNINIAALQVVNAANITVQGTATGLPTVASPNIGALDSAASAAGAATKTVTSPAQNSTTAQPSVLIVEIEGYGGDDGQNEPATPNQITPLQKKHERQSYDETSPYQVVGLGEMTDAETQSLANETRHRFASSGHGKK